ncbi:MAG: hypothetical protein V4617_07685 [Gemmatimonadota bacterium]
MNRPRWQVMGLALGLALLSTAQVSQAQGGEDDGEVERCASYCVACQGAPSPDWVFGDGGVSHGRNYLRYCTTGNCSGCPVHLNKTSTEQATGLIARVRTVRATEVGAALQASIHRLKVHPERGMVVVLGGCDGNAIEGVAFVSPDRVRALQRLGVGSLTSHIAAVKSTITRSPQRRAE